MSQRPGTVVLKLLVTEVSAPYQVGENNLQKRDLVGNTAGEMYPQDYRIEFVKENCSKLDDVKPGQFLTVHCNVRGIKVEPKPEDENQETKYWTSLQGWKIE